MTEPKGASVVYARERAEAFRSDGRHVCTRDDPWTESTNPRAIHPDARCVYDGGWEQEFERYECPHCGLRFTVEISC